MAHHEALYFHWAPSIENRQSPSGTLLVQQLLRLQQPRHYAPSQAEGAAQGSVGGTKELVRMGFDAQQLSR
jgi:hypothetical protein